MKSQKELTELLLGIRKSFLGLDEINDLLIVLSGFAQLFHGLNSFTQFNAPQYKMEYTNKIPFNQEGVVNLIADLYWMFEDFDNRFPLLLRATLQQEANRETRKRRKNFENIITSSSNLDFIYKAYKNYRLEHYIRDMNVPKNIKSFDNQAAVFIEKNYLTMTQVKKQFGIGDSELAYLMSKSTFKECYFNNGRATYFTINKTVEFLQVFSKEKFDKVTAMVAATLLGIHVDRVFDLLKDGVLEYSPYLEGNKTLSKKQINQLLFSLNAVEITNVEDKITITRCLEKYNTSGLSISKIISFIKTNQLFAYTQKVPYKLCDLFFEATEIAKILKEHRIFSKGLNLNQVSQELECSERTVLKYVNAGLLSKPMVEKIHNRKFVYHFEIKVIEAFKATFRSVEQIQKEYNVSESLVRNAIYRGVIKNYLSGICRKTLVNKWEFENYQNRGEDH
jgi:AraC-like DNA-binding protein